jgi:hypothetical protein
MKRVDGGSSCEREGSSNCRLLNIGNDNTDGIGCQVVKLKKGKGKRESGSGELDGGWFEWAWQRLGLVAGKPECGNCG